MSRIIALFVIVVNLVMFSSCSETNENLGGESMMTSWEPFLVPVLPQVKEVIEPRKILPYDKMSYEWTEIYKFIKPLTLDDNADVTAFYSVGLNSTLRVAGRWIEDEEKHWYREENTNAIMLVRFVPYVYLATEHGEPMINRINDVTSLISPEGHLRISTYIQPYDKSVSTNSSVALRELSLKLYDASSSGVGLFVSCENGIFIMLANLGEEQLQDLGRFVRFIDEGGG